MQLEPVSVHLLVLLPLLALSALHQAQASFWDAIPVISQIKSAVQAIAGDTEGAKRTQENFLDTAPAVSQIKSAVQSASGDNEGAKRTQERFLHEFVEPVAENTPVLGHAVGVGHLIAGNTQKGEQVLKGASSSAASLAGGLVGGPAGAIAAGAAMDSLITGVDSAVHGEFRPHGLNEFADSAARGQVSVGDVFDFGAGIGLEFAAGKGAKKATKPETQFGSVPAKRKHSELVHDVEIGKHKPEPDGRPAKRVDLKLDRLDLTNPRDLANARAFLEDSGLGAEYSSRLSARDFMDVNVVDGTLNCYYCSAAAAKGMTVKELVKKTGIMQEDTARMGPIKELFEASGFKDVVASKPMQRAQFDQWLWKATQSTKPVKVALGVDWKTGGGHMVNLEAWRAANGQVRTLVKDFQQPPFGGQQGGSAARFSSSLPENARRFHVLEWDRALDRRRRQTDSRELQEARAKSGLDGETASRLEMSDFLAVAGGAGELSDCPLCVLAGARGISTDSLARQLEEGQRPVGAEFMVDLYRQLGFTGVRLGGLMRAEQFVEQLDRQLRVGEQSQFTLVYWRPRLSGVHALQARAWKGLDGSVRLLTTDYQLPANSAARFSSALPEGAVWVGAMQLAELRSLDEQGRREENALKHGLQFELLRSRATADGYKCSAGTRIIGYLPHWSRRPFTVEQSLSVTNVVYAFMEMDGNGSLAMAAHTMARERMIDLLLARRAHQQFGLKLAVSFAIGGWTNSQHFSRLLAGAGTRAHLIGEIKRVLNTYKLDGVDIDWEYPITGGAQEGKRADRDNYVSFLAELRKSLGASTLVSLAAGAGQEAFAGYRVEELLRYADWLGVMSYDFFGAWDSKWGAQVGPNAPLQHSAPPGYSGKLNADWALKQYTCASGAVGAAKQPGKIVMGVPFYGRYWYNTSPIEGHNSEYPLYRLARPLDDNNGSLGGELAYWQIMDEWRIGRQAKFKLNWDNRSSTAWATDGSLVLSYENERSIGAKVDYAVRHHLGGIMIWALDQDDLSNSLLKGVFGAACHSFAANRELKYACNPLGEHRRWWSWLEDPLKAGQCGKNAPLYNGYYPVCDPDDPGYSCCSRHGFCGSGKDHCDCDGCLDYAKNPQLLTREPVKPSRPVGWHVGFELAKPGQPRCGPNAARLADGREAVCNPDAGDHCCSRWGFCGAGEQFCGCQGCQEQATNKSSSSAVKPVRWHEGFELAKMGQPRCGSSAPRLAGGEEAICNPDSSDHCCSRWGFCGSGERFCNCLGCVNYRPAQGEPRNK